MQLDLFAHSRDVMLRNELAGALRARDIPESRRARAALAAEYPLDRLLGPADVLIERLEAKIAAFANHTDALQTIGTVERETSPAAVAVFGSTQADQWLAPLWQALAAAAQRLPFRADAPEAHSAGLCIRARRWPDAEAAVARIESWRRVPRSLAWMAEAQFNLHGLQAVWPLLAELAWREPSSLAALVQRLDAPALTRILKEFERDFVTVAPTDLAWFPAWALIVEPALQTVLRTAETPERTPPEQAARAIMELLVLERQGRHHEIIQHRKVLKTLHPELFAEYMRTRS